MTEQAAIVTVTGTAKNPVFNIDIPTGAKGERGLQGERGVVGQTPQLKMGEVNTIANPSDQEWIAGMIRKSPVVTAALSETFPSTMRGEKGEKGDGGIPVGLIAADLDNYKSDGYYKMEAGADDIKNLPPTLVQKYGTLVVVTTNGVNRLEQIFYPTATSQGGKVFFIRSMAGNVWSPWRAITYQRVDNTAGKAIYTWDDVSQREQLIYGDTGWRDVPLSNSYVGNLYFRRVGYEVFVRGIIAKPEAAATIVGEFLTTIPVGFESETGAWIYYPVRGASSSLWFTLYRKGVTLSFDSTNVDVGQSRFEVSWSTTKPWPTTLPGIAVSGALGIIPNL